MKFTNGHWLMRPGVQGFYATQVVDTEVTANSLKVFASVRPILQRGDMQDGPQLRVEFSAPMADVVRVRLAHFEGQLPRGPFFELHEEPQSGVFIQEDEQAACLTSGRLTARISKKETWRVDFLGDGRPVTASPTQGMGLMLSEDGGHYLREQLSLGVGETVYGLGERFTAFVKNGQSVDIWNADGGTSSELAYKNIPFYLTNRGYGVFVNQPENVSFEVASEEVNRVQFSVCGQSLEYFLIYGPTPKEVLQKYTALTGRPALPPAWSFGLWLTTSFLTDYDEETVSSFIQGMAEREIPLHVFHYDCFWMKEFQWCDFEWDRRQFPDPEGMLRRLKERGLHICVWVNPYIAQRSPLFKEGMQKGYLVKRPDGSVWQWDRWQPGMGLVDFTNPQAAKWYGDKLRALVEMGVDCFKTDFGERVPTDVVYFDGSDPLKMHNYYTYLYNQTAFEVLEEKLGVGQATVFARSATAGSQKFSIHWGGDNSATFESMAESLRGGLSLGLSGFGYWSHDIGGFEMTAPAEVYKRWCAFGLLSSHSRLHGERSYRVPWLFGEEAVDILRFFTRLKCSLMPYLYQKAIEAHEEGWPVMRAMLLEFPDDPGCAGLDRQYMLGDALLAAPVFSADGWVDYYLPAGRWTHFLSGKVTEGGGWRREQHDYFSLPLLARPNSVIAVGADETRPDYDYAHSLTLHIFELEDGAEIEVNVPAGTGDAPFTARVSRTGEMIQAEAGNATGPWAMLLRGIGAVSGVEGGRAEAQALGMRITAEEGARSVRVRL